MFFAGFVLFVFSAAAFMIRPEGARCSVAAIMQRHGVGGFPNSYPSPLNHWAWYQQPSLICSTESARLAVSFFFCLVLMKN